MAKGKKQAGRIQLGRFYRYEDASGYSHPAIPYKAYRKKKKYDVVSFSTSKKKTIKLDENIDPNAEEKLKPGEKLQGSYIRKRPERVSETTLKKRYEDYRLATNADKKLFRKIRKLPPKIRGKNDK